MKHPNVIPGANGLPPTSDIPWSAKAELSLRSSVLAAFFSMLICLAASLALVAFHSPGLSGIFFVLAVVSFAVLRVFQSELHVMRLNRPRTLANLTRWVRHEWPGSAQCACGRPVVLLTAEYFPETRRFARVCDCGIGHYLLMPANAAQGNIARGIQ